jgi:hypothetical protein
MPTASIPAIVHPTSIPVHGVPAALSTEVIWPEHEADHSPASNVEVDNGWAILPISYTSGIICPRWWDIC